MSSASKIIEENPDDCAILVCLKDCRTNPPTWKQYDTACEQAYRRGFHQGGHAAIRGIGETTLEAVERWLDGRLYKWRLKRHKGRVEFPPEVKSK